MLLFNAKKFEPDAAPEAEHLYRFFFLSMLLYHDLWRWINKDLENTYVAYDDFRWAQRLELPLLDRLTPQDLKGVYKRSKTSAARLKGLLMQAYRRLSALPLQIPEGLAHNLALISDSFKLTEAEKTVLLFFSVMSIHDRDVMSIFSYLKSEANDVRSYEEIIADFLTTVSDCSFAELKKALTAQATLASNHLLDLSDLQGSRISFPLAQPLPQRIFSPAATLSELMGIALVRGSESCLSLEDFAYLNPNLEHLVGYLGKAQSEHRPGVNVLLYGPPGSGKTELSHVIGKALNLAYYEVPVTDEEGFAIENRRRYLATSLAQLRERQDCLLIFDEAQDFFHEEPSIFGELFQRGSPDKRLKGYTNKLLETVETPIIWITNSIESMDRAYLRRFDFVMEVSQPPEETRVQIIENLAGKYLSADALKALARRDDIMPGLFGRTANVVATLGCRKQKAEKAFLSHLNATLQAIGFKPVTVRADKADTLYRPELSTADMDLKALARGIRRSGSARLCLYGVPGTGKTAWSRFLAEKLGKPIMVRKASDLLSCYVGQSEQNMAAAFEAARRDDAVLVIDEADSFLQKRSNAHHNWEASMVNEMLTQIENFEGVFVATTNCLEMMDEAVLRRFDFKIKFGYLDSDRAQKLFKLYAKALCPKKRVSAGLLEAVSRLRQLTPGDFATVTRQARFAPVATPEALLERLQKECAVKEGHSHRPIGF